MPLIRRLAALAGVQVEVAHGDAHALESFGPADAALAIESSCYFDRARWFRELARLTSRVHVVDCFTGRPEAAPRFDAYWKTHIGSRREYDAHAEAAGFSRVHAEDLAPRVHTFWTLSTKWNELAARESPEEAARLERSTLEHEWLAQALAAGDIRYFHVAYERRGICVVSGAG